MPQQAPHNPKMTYLGIYDFSVVGGTTGDKSLTGGNKPPKNHVPLRLIFIEETAMTSAGSATFGLKTGNDVVVVANTANAFDSFTNNIIGTSTVETAKLDADDVGSAFKFSIAGAALTAGKVKVFMETMSVEVDET